MMAWGLQANLSSHLFEGLIPLRQARQCLGHSPYFCVQTPPSDHLRVLSLAGGCQRECERWSTVILTRGDTRRTFSLGNKLTFYPDMSPCLWVSATAERAELLPWVSTLSVKRMPQRCTLTGPLLCVHTITTHSPDGQFPRWANAWWFPEPPSWACLSNNSHCSR